MAPSPARRRGGARLGLQSIDNILHEYILIYTNISIIYTNILYVQRTLSRTIVLNEASQVSFIGLLCVMHGLSRGNWVSIQ